LQQHAKAKGEFILKTKTKIQPQEWTETKDQTQSLGQKVLVFVWRDETVCQAWWNGEHYLLVAADEQGLVNVYQVPPISISHWRTMPDMPAMTNSNNVHHISEHKRSALMH